MKRLIPYPVLFVALLAFWLVLGDAVTPGRLISGLLAALVGTRLMTALRLEEPQMGRLGAALRLAVAVSIDIIRSNIAVARIIGRPGRPMTAGFLSIPLRIEHPTALAILAGIVTATPGTIWVHFDPDAGVLILHILDLVDEDAWLGTIQGRYEQMLMEVFE